MRCAGVERSEVRRQHVAAVEVARVAHSENQQLRGRVRRGGRSGGRGGGGLALVCGGTRGRGGGACVAELQILLDLAVEQETKRFSLMI